MVTAGPAGGLNYPERLHGVPLTRRSFTHSFDTQTLSGARSPAFPETHPLLSQTGSKTWTLFKVHIPLPGLSEPSCPNEAVMCRSNTSFPTALIRLKAGV